MKKFIVSVTIVDNENNRPTVKENKVYSTYDEMDAFVQAANFVKWAKEYIEYWYCVDFEDSVDYVLSISTATEEETEEDEEDFEEDEEDFEDFED